MKTILFLGIMQLTFTQMFAQGHDRDNGHSGFHNYNSHYDRGHITGHNYATRPEARRYDANLHRNTGIHNYYDRGHTYYRNNYALHNNVYAYNHYRAEPFFGYAHPYNRAYLPLINLSFGTSYPYGYAYQSDFERVLIAINSQPYDDGKLIVAKQAVQNRSLTCDEVSTIMRGFAYDETRLEFAETVYDHVIDKQNFYTVNNCFAYTTSVDDLNNFLQSQYGTH